MNALTEESGIPHAIAAVVARFAGRVERFFPAGSLRMGGGTVLQARWGHRQSTDADLFCDPAIYSRVVRQHGPAIERAIREIADRGEEMGTFVDQMATFSRIEGTEITLLPAVPLVGLETGHRVPGTSVATDSSADILAGKLVHRLGGAAVVEPRDLFDLLVAERHDPNALRQATGLLTRNQLAEISAMLLMLPRKWASISEKQVLSVSGERRDVDPIAVVDLLGRFAGPTPGPPGKRRLEP